jgi:poly(A) polymerase
MNEIIINGKKAVLGPEEPFDPRNPEHLDSTKYMVKHGTVDIHVKQVMSFVGKDPDLVWAALFHDLGKPPTHTEENGHHHFYSHETVGTEMAKIIMERFKFSNEATERILFLVENHMWVHNVKGMRNATIRRMIGQEHFADLRTLGIADCLGSDGKLDEIHFLDGKIEEFSHLPVRPTPLITGRDLIDLGLKPGPKFKDILDTMLDKQLEQVFTTREHGLEILKEII